MIYLYSGTPGSGKSLHMAKDIYFYLKKSKRYVICNFEIRHDLFTKEELERFYFVDNKDLTIEFLYSFHEKHFKEFENEKYQLKEKCFVLFIDEAQALFNARQWQRTKNQNWAWFFSVHRHLGYRIILCSQMDTNLDKQVRGVIEYNMIHRKISNIGLAGKFVNLLCGGGLFYSVQYWYPMRMKTGGQFFRYKKRLGDLYDTQKMFTNNHEENEDDFKIFKIPNNEKKDSSDSCIDSDRDNIGVRIS